MLTIGHISDLHFSRTRAQLEQTPISESLLHALQGQEWQPDLFVVSGDLSSVGSPAEFELVSEWLLRLMTAPWNPRLFIVPGNHDVNRRTQAISRRFANFLTAHANLKDKLGPLLLSDWIENSGCAQSVALSGLQIQIVGLNTALSNSASIEDGQATVDTDELRQRIESMPHASDLVFVIGHHPIAALNRQDRTVVETLLRANRSIYLHGHDHSFDRPGATAMTSEGYVSLSAGSAYATSPWPQYFSMYKCNPDGSELHSRRFSYSVAAGVWVADERLTRRLSLTFGTPNPRSGSRDFEILPDMSGRADVALQLHAFQTVNLARTAQSILTQFFNSLPDLSVYAIRSRVKSVESIIQKVFRKRQTGMQGYGVDDLTDVCGFRFVALIDRDIISILQRLLSFLSDPRTPLRRDKGVELNIYSTGKDDLRAALENVARRAEVDLHIRTMTHGYTSVQLAAFCSLPQFDGTEVLVPVEFQLRNALDEIWGEIDHRLRYKYSTAVAQDLAVLRVQFDALKAYLQDLVERIDFRERASSNGLSTNASLLTSEVNPPQPDRPPQRLERLWDLSPSLKTKLEIAYELWEAADATRQFGGDASLYRQAADAFGLVLDSTPTEIRDSSLVRELTPIACAERGYLLSCTGDPSDLREAKAMYERTLGYEPDNPVAHFRLGQILIRTGEMTRSVVHFKEAIRLRKDEDNWLYDAARLGLGRASWGVFNEQHLPLDEREMALKEAIEITRSLYSDPVDRSVRQAALNNLLYYACEERTHSVQESRWQVGSLEFEQLLDALANENERLPTKFAAVEDTLVRAYSHIGDRERAFLHATRVRDLLVATEAMDHRDPPLRGGLPSSWLVNSRPRPERKMNRVVP